MKREIGYWLRDRFPEKKNRLRDGDGGQTVNVCDVTERDREKCGTWGPTAARVTVVQWLKVKTER